MHISSGLSAATKVVYAWVDKLNIRATPARSGEVVTTVDTGTPLSISGEKSEKAELIVLRGVAYEEPWLEVITPEGLTGWVFGGAVRQPEEEKGNAPITETSFNFPYFGQFDLDSWEQLSRRDIEAGDAFGTEATYRQGSRLLEIRRTQTSEYGYQYSYTLREGKDQQLVKRRVLSFDATDGHILTETVDNFLSEPPLRQERTQLIGQHFSRLNARPEMARGAWTTYPLFQDVNQRYQPEKVTLSALGTTGCAAAQAADSGCSCAFYLLDDQEEQTIFYSDLGANACVRIDGELIALREADYNYAEEVRAKVGRQPWVTKTQTGEVKVLGDYVEGDWEDALRDALMATDQLPEQVEVKNEYTGMAIREVRDAVAEIFAEVKANRASGLKMPSKWRYEGGGYRVWVKVRNITNYGGEADTYEGFLEVEREAYLPLFRRAIRGSCGC